jgi:hypothetical protein
MSFMASLQHGQGGTGHQWAGAAAPEAEYHSSSMPILCRSLLATFRVPEYYLDGEIVAEVRERVLGPRFDEIASPGLNDRFSLPLTNLPLPLITI